MCGNSDGSEIHVTSVTCYLQLLKVTKRMKLIEMWTTQTIQSLKLCST